MDKANYNTFMTQCSNNRHEYAPAMLDQPRWVNAYEMGRAYGGAEEGGWWYNYYEPLNTIRVRTLKDAENAYELLHDIHAEYYEGGVDIGSVIHDGDFVIYLEDHEAKHEPSERPHYE